MTCSVSSSSTGIDSASASTARYAASSAARPSAPDVRQAIVEPVVAEDGGGDRVALQDAVPEAVGEVVDEGVGIGGDGHFGRGLSSGLIAGKVECTPRALAGQTGWGAAARSSRPPQRPPKRSASSAAGVSSSWS